MSSIAKHVKIASLNGMKAGFKVFAANASKSGLPQVADLWSEFEPLNAKGRFDLYCATYGDLVASLGEPVATQAATVEDRKVDEIQRLIEQANELLSKAEELRSAKATVVKTAKPKGYTRSTPKAQPKAAQPKLTKTTFGAKVVALLGLPTKVGKAFTYKGKHGSSKWVVTAKLANGGIAATRA